MLRFNLTVSPQNITDRKYLKFAFETRSANLGIPSGYGLCQCFAYPTGSRFPEDISPDSGMAPGANAILVFDPEADANPSRTGTRRPALQSPAGGTVKQRESE